VPCDSNGTERQDCSSVCHAINRAMPKAAAAAKPPTTTVCTALFSGLATVNRALPVSAYEPFSPAW
jgi:hypothetical protein